MKTWNEENDSPSQEKISKGIGKALETKLNKIYKPSTRFDDTFKGNDITYITNENGEPVTLYIGKRNADGNISGNLFTRKIKSRQDNKITESHWDNKGKVTKIK